MRGDRLAPIEFYRVPDNSAGSITISIRIPYCVNDRLEELTNQVNLSKNRVINMMLEYCLNNMVIKDNYSSQNIDNSVKE